MNTKQKLKFMVIGALVSNVILGTLYYNLGYIDSQNKCFNVEQ